MPAPSLLRLAQKEGLRNWRWITQSGDFGDISYPLVRDILFKIEDPKRLREIEIQSPQICGPDGEIWLEFIKRDVPGWHNKRHEPKNPQNWYKVYRKLVAESEKEIALDAQELKAKLQGIKAESDKHKLQQIELAKVNLPRGMVKNGPTLNIKCDLRQGVPNGARIINTNLKAKDPKSARGKLDQLKKQAKGMSMFAQQPKLSLNQGSKSASKISLSKTAVVKAPIGMVEEYRRPIAEGQTDSSAPRTQVFTPKRKREEPEAGNISSEAIQTATADPESRFRNRNDTQEERERRLKALTNPASVTAGIKSEQPLSTRGPLGNNETVYSPTTNEDFEVPIPSKEEPMDPSKITETVTPSLMTPPPSERLRMPKSGSPPSRSRFSSPANRGSPVPKTIKPKAPVDIFMRPVKRPKVS